MLDRLPELQTAARVQTGRRLIEEQHGRARNERRGQVEPAAHATGIGLRRAARRIEEFETVEQLPATLLRHGARLAVQAPDHREVLEPREVLVDGGILTREPDPLAEPRSIAHDIEPVHLGATGVRLQERRENPDDRRLAGAVRAEQAEDGAVGDFEVDAIERPYRAIGLLQTGCADRCGRSVGG